jgi:hypothetical protein
VLRLVHVVGGEEDGLAERLQPLDHLPGLAARGRVEAGGRLVEEDQVGVADDADGDVDAPLLAAGERADAGVALGAEAGQLDRLLDRSRRRVEGGEEGDRLAHRQQRVELALLQDEADALAPGAGRLRGVGAEHRDLAAARLAVALEDLDRRRLSGSVGPEEAEHLAGRDLEVDAPHRFVLAIGLAQPAHPYRRFAHRAHASQCADPSFRCAFCSPWHQKAHRKVVC